MLAAAEGGAEDVAQDGDVFEVTVRARGSGRRSCRRRGRRLLDRLVRRRMVPKTTVEVDDEATARKVMRLIDTLEDSDDVQEVYANFDIPDQVLEAVAS